jgi:hypothetical protein
LACAAVVSAAGLAYQAAQIFQAPSSSPERLRHQQHSPAVDCDISLVHGVVGPTAGLRCGGIIFFKFSEKIPTNELLAASE